MPVTVGTSRLSCGKAVKREYSQQFGSHPGNPGVDRMITALTRLLGRDGMTDWLVGVIAAPRKIQRLSVGTPSMWAVFWLALLAGAMVLAVALAHAVSFTLGASVERAVAQLVGAAVGSALLGSLGVLALLLPRRTVIVLAIALGCVLAASLAGAVFIGYGTTPRMVRFGEAAWVAMPLVLLALLALQAGVEAHRADVLRALGAVASDWGWLVLLAGTLAATAIYVEASRRILFWDWAFYWSKVDTLADLVRQGQWRLFAQIVVHSVGDDLSLIPAALPGLVMAPLPGNFLLGYVISVVACYLVPALLAVGALGFALACTVTPAMDELPWRDRIGLTTLGAVAALLLLPHFLQVVLRFNMLDVGGVAVLVLLAFAWRRMLRVLLAPPMVDDAVRQTWRVLAAAASVTALSVLDFVFRRWYVFDVVGFAVAALCFLVAALPRQGRRWRNLFGDLALAAGAALLTVIATATPILVKWVLQWRNRNYAEAYAAYSADWSTILIRFQAEFGLLVPALCGLLAVVLLLRGRQRVLPGMLVLGTVVGVLGFHQIQGPSVQHYYLLMPLLGGLAAGGAILLAREIGPKPTLLILFAAGWFLGLAPRHYGAALAFVQPTDIDLWPHRDADADELARLGQWLNGSLGPDERYCVIASGTTVNWSVLTNVWQVDPSLIGGKAATRIMPLPEVDTRDGPPTNALEHCSLMITATPPQTHLRPSDQQSILLLLDDVLHARGLGAAYARLDTAFRLPSGTTLAVFRQRHPIDDDALRDLRRRFYDSKGAQAGRYEARFGAP